MFGHFGDIFILIFKINNLIKREFRNKIDLFFNIFIFF